MQFTKGLPKTGDAQDIGEEAESCLFANKPKGWKLTNGGGTADYGLDFQVQIAEDQQVKAVFRLQLKGTRAPTPNATGAYFSVALSASTLRLYGNIPEPILLALCDLSVDPGEPKNCPIYYVWVRPELRRVGVESIPLAQDEKTLRVPKSNLMARGNNLLEDVRRANELAQVGDALDMTISEVMPNLSEIERVDMVLNVAAGTAMRGAAFLSAAAEPPLTYWIEPARGTLAWHLRTADALLNSGRLERAAAELAKSGAMLATATGLEAAEHWYLSARARSYDSDSEGARDAYLRSLSVHPQAKAWVGWAEAETRLRFDVDGPNDFSDVIAKLPEGDEPKILALKARLLAAERKYPESLALLETISGQDRLASLAVVRTMTSDARGALDACVEGLATPGITDSSRLLFTLLKARAKFNLAIDSASERPAPGIVPLAGLKGMDVELLKDAWTDIEKAALDLGDIGWSANGEFVADIWGAAASMLGRQQEILPALLAAAKSRPKIEGLQASAEAAAAQCGDFEAALEANARLPVSDTQTLRRVCLLHESKRHRECVGLLESRLPKLDRTHPNFPGSLVVAAMSAHLLAREELVRTWAAILDSDIRFAPHRALLDYHLAVALSKNDNTRALLDLERRYAELGQPEEIAFGLFVEYDFSYREQAAKCAAIGERIQASRRLSGAAASHYATALAILGNWSALRALCASFADSRAQYPRLRAFEGLALDRLGRTEEARAVLEEMIEGGLANGVALKAYVAIMVRCGFVKEALDAAEKIFESATNDRQRVECVRLLFNLTQSNDPVDPRLLALAWRMGELADPEDEVEEGVHLVMVLTATMGASNKLSPAQSGQFQARAQAFFRRFPDSKLFRKIEISKGKAPAEMIAALREIVGVDEGQLDFQAKMANELDRGLAPIPFAWRPKRILAHVHDVVQLWEVCKRSGKDDLKHHLQMTTGEWAPTPPLSMRGPVPLFDLVALLVLTDLDLLELAYDFFGRVAIAQETFGELARLAHPFSGSPWRDRCLDLQSRLKARLGATSQPVADPPVADNRFEGSSEEVRQLAESGEYRLFSDDALFRIYCAGDEGRPQGLCTADLLFALEDEGLLTPRQVAEKLARLCEWNVGLLVPARYQVVLFPPGLDAARNASEGIGMLWGDPDFAAMANGLWDVRQPLEIIQGNIAALSAALLSHDETPTVVIASFVGAWHGKVKLRDASIAPLGSIASMVTVIAAQKPGLSDSEARRLWSVYLELVEFEHGSDAMDMDKEKGAIELIAQIAAGIDCDPESMAMLAGAPTLKSRLERGLVEKTSRADVFATAYTAHVMTLSVRAMRKR